MATIQELEERIAILEKRIAELEHKEVGRESELGLDVLKQKIVAMLKAGGEDADINSEEVRLMAIQMRDELGKRADKTRERLRPKGSHK